MDADLEHLSKRSVSEVNSKVQATSSLHFPSERAIDSSLHVEIGLSNGERCNSSSTSEVNGINESSSDGSTETQLAESEQATYASANNDLKGTKAYQEADVPGLYNLAMAIIDYRGHRVVAQVCTYALLTLISPFLYIYIFDSGIEWRGLLFLYVYDENWGS